MEYGKCCTVPIHIHNQSIKISHIQLFVDKTYLHKLSHAGHDCSFGSLIPRLLSVVTHKTEYIGAWRQGYDFDTCQ